MRAEIEIQKKIAELRATSPDWFLQFTKMDMPPELEARVTEYLQYIKAGMILGMVWALGFEDKELLASLFDLDKLEKYGLKLEDFDIGG